MRATILLDCPPESAQRYTALISALEDVSEVGLTQTIKVALIETSGDWRKAARRAGIEAHENADTVVASGRTEKVEEFLATLGDDVEDTVRNVGVLASQGMRETDRVILKIMTE